MRVYHKLPAEAWQESATPKAVWKRGQLRQ